MDNTGQLPTVLAFCAGYAGIERGLDLAGVEHRVLAYVEIEAFAIANLVKKMEDGDLPPAPIWTDIKTFPAHLFRGHVDLITGGYPCQPFSAAGKRLGKDDPRHLWPFIDHHIGIINPRRVFFENVDGHVSLGLNTVISDLEERGYYTTWGVFSASEVGAPHQRKRVYIMGDTNDSRSGESGAVREGSDGSEPISNGEAWGVRSVADSSGVRLQRPCDPGDSGEKGAQPNDQQLDRCSAPQSGTWEVEPRMGRVVDGCADYVDRIRLLGNGVVPQTAAKAWAVLDSEIRT